MAKAERARAIRPLRPEFEEFLYSSIGELNDDVPSSVLSMLARQNLDPWEEAAHLAQLSRESAVFRLTSMISSATSGASAVSAPETAARLMGLLPQPDSFNIRSLSQSPDEMRRHFAPIITYLVLGAIAIIMVLLAAR
jgi:hypothetical protein